MAADFLRRLFGWLWPSVFGSSPAAPGCRGASADGVGVPSPSPRTPPEMIILLREGLLRTQRSAQQVAADAAARETDPAVRAILQEFATSPGPVDAGAGATKAAPDAVSGPPATSRADGGAVVLSSEELPGGLSRGGIACSARSRTGPEEPGPDNPPAGPGRSVDQNPTKGRAASAPAVGHADSSVSAPHHAQTETRGPAQWPPGPVGTSPVRVGGLDVLADRLAARGGGVLQRLLLSLLDFSPTFRQALCEAAYQRAAELARWEDDGGPSTEVSPCGSSSRPSRSPSSSSASGPAAAPARSTAPATDGDRVVALPRPAPGRYEPSGTFPLPPPSADPFRLGHLADARLFLLNAALALEAASIELGGRHAVARELASIHDAAEAVRERLAALEIQLMRTQGVALA